MGKKPTVSVCYVSVVDGPIYGPFMGCNVTGFPPSVHAPQSRDVSCFSLKSFHFRGLRNQ